MSFLDMLGLACVMLAMAVGTWLISGTNRPSGDATPPSFDIMLDSASPGLKTHPCATDPARACFTIRLMGDPLTQP